jgi:hypothetical protein
VTVVLGVGHVAPLEVGPVLDEVAGQVGLGVAVALADEVQLHVAGALTTQGHDLNSDSKIVRK